MLVLYEAHRETQEFVDLTHPLGVASGQVVVDCDNVDSLARKGVEVDGHGGGERLPLAGFHLGNLALV
jgi:hypothetical protein